MATTEELDLVIKTVADTTGAQQVAQSLQKTQQAAAGAQQTMNAGQQGANTVMRALMQQHAQTLENFEKARQTVSASVGVTPTLLPRDFGIQAVQAAAAARTAAAATASVGQAAEEGNTNLLRFGLAVVGAGGALSVFTKLGELARDAVTGVVQGTLDQEQAFRANTNALGQQAAGYQAWAAGVSQAAGVTQRSLLEAGTAAAQFGRQVGFGPQQTQGLVDMARALAVIQGTDPSQTITQLTAALGGNQQAANGLQLQLDAATISYQQFGDATGQVFDLLDPSTQAALRYQSAVEQIGRQAATAAGPQLELAKATGQFGSEIEKFVNSVGPGAVAALAKVVEGANGAITAVQRLNELQLERYKQSGAGDEDFKNEQALAQGVVDRLTQGTAGIRGAVGQGASDLGTKAKEINDQLRDTTGFDAQATAANLAAAAYDKAQQGLDAAGQAADDLKQKAGATLDAITAPLRAADQADRARASSAQDARDAQLRAAVAQVANPLAVRDAATRNEATAAQALVQLQREKGDLLADEANIRLTMLPTQERMLELQNETNRAQIQATQQALPSSRALQDLQLQLDIQRDIATSEQRSLAERQAAQRAGAGLLRQLPEAQLAAARAQAAGLPAQRAAQDVGLAAQLQGLDLQQALFPDQFRVDLLTQLATIAGAAKTSAARDIATINAVISTTINQTTGPISADDEKRIVSLTSDEFARQLHSAVQQVDKAPAPASNQLLAGGA